MKALLLPFVLFLNLSIQAQDHLSIKYHGVKIFVDDLNAAEDFYVRFLGFEKLSRDETHIKLKTNTFPLYLERSLPSGTGDPLKRARAGIAIQVGKLLPAIDQCRSSGIRLIDTLLSRNGVGIAIPIQDPSGNILHLIEVQVMDVSAFEGFRIYNSGVTVNNMEKAEAFYKGILGFQDWSRNYLPQALPLKHQDGGFAFMLHQQEGLLPYSSEYGANKQQVLVFEVPDLNQLKPHFENKRISYHEKNGILIVRDPEGNHLNFLEN